jgi:nicotinamidase/pyrazinamidase
MQLYVLPPGTEIISKPMDPDQEAYSGFDGTDLAHHLRRKGIGRVFVGGLATEYCVKNTVLDAIKEGFQAVLLRDAVRGVEAMPGDSGRAIKEMERKGAALAVLDQIESSKE